MSFEHYTQLYGETAEGLVLRPKGKGQTVTFPLKKKENVRYRLFTVGETEQFYHWKNEPDCPFLYRSLTDALDTEHAIRDRYCLDLSSKKPESYLRRVYRKIAWPPKLSYLLMNPLPTDWTLGVTVTARDLTFKKGGYLRMRIDVRLLREGVDPRSTEGEPDLSLVIPFPEGTYTGERLSLPVKIPQNTAHVGVFIEGVGYRGSCYVEQPFLSADGQNLLPSFNESIADKEKLDWTAQYLSRKEWPEFRVRLNGRVIYTGEIFERCHRCSEWELDLPTALLSDVNTLTYELISSYHDPLPYTIHEIGVIESDSSPLSIVAVSEVAPVGGKARVLVRTAHSNATVRFESLSDALSGEAEYHFREKGLHGILLSCNKPAHGASFRLTLDGFTATGTVSRTVLRTCDRVITGTGDMIYVHQDVKSVEDYLSWYLSNGIGDLVTVRPTYRWSGTRTLDRASWRLFRRIMRELDLKYVLMADGREIPGLSTQPAPELQGGKGFLGTQMHERDGAQYYWGLHRCDTPTLEMYADLLRFAYREDPLHTGSQYSDSNYVYNAGGGINLYADRDMPRDYRLAHEKSVESLRRMRRDRDTRHTGPSCMFRTMHEAGFRWVGAETMYSTMEPLMGFLRGTAQAYGMKTYGVHHAVQWSSSPHESPARYRRYRIALYASYLLGATDINTEEGLWRLEEYYSYHHRFGTACRAHLKEQQDFYRYVSTHSRTGRFHTPAAFLHGRDDGVTFFGGRNTWGLRGTRTPADASWELLTAVYPKALPMQAVYRHGCPEDVPQGYHSGTPYGNLDAVPAEASLRALSNYRLLLCLGYNRLADGDAEKLLSFVRRGGRLLLTRAHLTTTSDIDRIIRGDLDFSQTPLSLTKGGSPDFRETTIGGRPISVCTNPKAPSEVLYTTDDGTPLVLLYRIGDGEIVLFNVKDYPSAPAIRSLYESEMTRLLRETNREESVYAETGDDVEFATYAQEDGTTHVYFLAVDWYRDPMPDRKAILRIGNAEYPVRVPFGTLVKCVSDNESAAWVESEDAEVLSLAHNTVTVQGTGQVTILFAKDGRTARREVDFTDLPMQTLEF